MKIIKKFGLGILLILCAFWAGTLPSMVFSFLGFLSFFLAGVALIIEGRKKQTTDHRPETRTEDQRLKTED
jgi:hypothetical protein